MPSAGKTAIRWLAPRRPCEHVPAGIAPVLRIVTILIAFGGHLAATLERRARGRGFATIAQFFGTATVASILPHLRRGILRAEALQRLLLARALRGRDLRPPAPPRPPRRPAQPAPRRSARRIGKQEPLTLATLPSADQLDAEVRRRPIGRTLAAICRDLGVAPLLCQGAFWNELFAAIPEHGGNLVRLVLDLQGRAERYVKQEVRRHPELGWPEETSEGIRRVLGFFIGEPPVDPFALGACRSEVLGHLVGEGRE